MLINKMLIKKFQVYIGSENENELQVPWFMVKMVENKLHVLELKAGCLPDALDAILIKFGWKIVWILEFVKIESD